MSGVMGPRDPSSGGPYLKYRQIAAMRASGALERQSPGLVGSRFVGAIVRRTLCCSSCSRLPTGHGAQSAFDTSVSYPVARGWREVADACIPRSRVGGDVADRDAPPHSSFGPHPGLTPFSLHALAPCSRIGGRCERTAYLGHASARTRARSDAPDASAGALLMPHPLEDLFHPEGVAIIGQVNRALSEAQLRALHDPRYGAGNWSLVNPKGGAIGGLTIYPSVRDVPGPRRPGRDQRAARGAVRRSGARVRRARRALRRGVQLGLLRDRPRGRGARARARRRRARARACACSAPTRTTTCSSASPIRPAWRGGRIGVVAQSGHNGRPIVQGTVLGVGFRARSPAATSATSTSPTSSTTSRPIRETAVIAGYIEGFRDGAKLRRALAAALAARKPVVLLKMGSTRGGARMAQLAHGPPGRRRRGGRRPLRAARGHARARSRRAARDRGAVRAPAAPARARARRSTASRAARER